MTTIANVSFPARLNFLSTSQQTRHKNSNSESTSWSYHRYCKDYERLFRGADCSRRLRTEVVGMGGGVTETRRQAKGEGTKETHSAFAHTWSPTGSDHDHTHARCLWLPATCVCWGRKLWFLWLGDGSHFLLREEKKVTQGIWKARGTPVSKKLLSTASSCTLTGVCLCNFIFLLGGTLHAPQRCKGWFILIQKGHRWIRICIDFCEKKK